MEELINQGIQIAADKYPAAAVGAALVLPLQFLAAKVAPLVKRKHSTWLHRGLTWFAAFPYRAPTTGAR